MRLSRKYPYSMGRQVSSSVTGHPVPDGQTVVGGGLTELSLEAKVVTCAAQTTVRSPERLRRLASQSVDWTTVQTHAQTHGVVPLVSESLSEHCPELVPDEILESLEAAHLSTATHNLKTFQELVSVLDQLQTEDIQVIPYRGPVLANDVYDELSLRQFTDLDLFVHRSDIPAIRALLVENGYTRQFERQSTTELTTEQEWAYTTFRRDYPFYHAESDTMIELHWRVLDRRFPTAIELEEVWDRRETTTISGQTVPVLSPEDRLLTLCVHGTRHYWERLGWICDVAELTGREDIDWSAVLERARAHNAERMFLLGPALANRVYGVSLPEFIFERIEADERIGDLERHILDRLFEPDRFDENDLAAQLRQLKTLDSHLDGIQLLGKWLLTPSRDEIETFALPRTLAFCYILYRPLHLLSFAVRDITGSDNPSERDR